MQRREIEKKSETVVVSLQGLFALTLLVFALENLQLSEPLRNGIGDSRPARLFPLCLDRNACLKRIEVRLLLLLGVDCRFEVVADRFPRTGAIGASEYRRK